MILDGSRHSSLDTCYIKFFTFNWSLFFYNSAYVSDLRLSYDNLLFSLAISLFNKVKFYDFRFS